MSSCRRWPADGAAPKPNVAPASAPRAGEVVNELMPFLEFVEHHPIGTSVNGIVDDVFVARRVHLDRQ